MTAADPFEGSITLLRGSLLAGSFIECLGRHDLGRELARIADRVHAGRLARALKTARAQLGPASPVRSLLEQGLQPLAGALGYHTDVERFEWQAGAASARLGGASGAGATAFVTAWRADLETVWRDGVRAALLHGSAWCLAYNGCQVRMVDARRVYARGYLEIDLDLLADDPVRSRSLLALMHAHTLSGAVSLFDRLVRASDTASSAVCAHLEIAVREAALRVANALLGGRRSAAPSGTAGRLFEHALTVIYRILFLLFAEARSLVPLWHPIYRRAYSVGGLLDDIERAGRARGLWAALQAMSALAHAGCTAGALRVVAFNGQLFDPAVAPLLDHARLSDDDVREVLVALATTRATVTRDRSDGRRRIAFAELGVEQLGGVYESVLDFSPSLDVPPAAAGTPRRPRLVLRGGTGPRKSTGAYYTPRSITEFLVRRTLAPLLVDAPPEAVLALKVLDPAVGSGAFLVAACRYLTHAYEQAVERTEGRRLSEGERADASRLVAQRCLFGVDRNPMAVQLARLSLWLTTMARDRPLSFLDHHLRVGNSLVGAGLDEIARPPEPITARRRTPCTPMLPFFDGDDVTRVMQPVRRLLDRWSSEPDTTAAVVRSKTLELARLTDARSPLEPWRRVADLWCGLWFRDEELVSGGRGVYADLATWCLDRRGSLPERTAGALVSRARSAAASIGAFHWPFEFPEVFFDEAGLPAARAGFDAVLGNPPWDMVRADVPRGGPASDARADRVAVTRMVRFARESGVYSAGREAHLNSYQLFVERACSLLRRGGRLGLVLPWGFAADHGAAVLRRQVLDTCAVDTLVGLDNRHAIFPIHRGVRFCLVTATRGEPTDRITCRHGVSDPSELDEVPDRGFPRHSSRAWMSLSRSLLLRVGGERMPIPDVRSALDVQLLERLHFTHPTLSASEGWGVQFGRELNATDDRRHFSEAGAGLPVVEGKDIAPFRVVVRGNAQTLDERRAGELLDRSSTFGRARVCYRDITSPTNRLTLIAAVLPAGSVSTHTLFCAKTPLDDDDTWALCALLNSYVANYLVRLRVSNHVTTSIVHALPVPRPSGRWAAALADLARRLAARDDRDVHARLQAAAFRLYGLRDEEVHHVLDTFPLVAAEEKRRVQRVLARGTCGRGGALSVELGTNFEL